MKRFLFVSLFIGGTIFTGYAAHAVKYDMCYYEETDGEIQGWCECYASGCD